MLCVFSFTKNGYCRANFSLFPSQNGPKRSTLNLIFVRYCERPRTQRHKYAHTYHNVLTTSTEQSKQIS